MKQNSNKCTRKHEFIKCIILLLENDNKRSYDTVNEGGKNVSNVVKGKKKTSFITRIWRDRSLWLFCLPGMILTFIFSYIPMYGVQIAFRKYNARLGIWGSQWVGLKYFERFFDSPYFASTISNTLILSLYGLIASFPIPI